MKPVLLAVIWCVAIMTAYAYHKSARRYEGQLRLLAWTGLLDVATTMLCSLYVPEGREGNPIMAMLLSQSLTLGVTAMIAGKALAVALLFYARPAPVSRVFIWIGIALWGAAAVWNTAMLVVTL